MSNRYIAIIAIVITAVAMVSFYVGHNVGMSMALPSVSSNTTPWPNIHQNVATDFNPTVKYPQIQNDTFIHPFAVVIGDCYIGKMVLMAPTSVCRGDEGTPIHIGDYSNVQDGVILHALETTIDEQNIDSRRFSENGDRLLANDSRFDQADAILVGHRVRLAHVSRIL